MDSYGFLSRVLQVLISKGWHVWWALWQWVICLWQCWWALQQCWWALWQWVICLWQCWWALWQHVDIVILANNEWHLYDIVITWHDSYLIWLALPFSVTLLFHYRKRGKHSSKNLCKNLLLRFGVKYIIKYIKISLKKIWMPMDQRFPANVDIANICTWYY